MIKLIASAALATVMTAGAAHASINAVQPLEIDVVPTVAASSNATVASADLDAFIERLERQSDDGTLNERDHRAIRSFQTAAATVEELTDQLKRQSDDGTLNERDFQTIRDFTA